MTPRRSVTPARQARVGRAELTGMWGAAQERRVERLAAGGGAWQTGDAERLIRTVQEAEGHGSASGDAAEARRQIGGVLHEG